VVNATLDHVSEVEVIEALDFDEAIMCEGRGCEAPAVWLCWITCCAMSRYGCEAHRHATIEWLAKVARLGGVHMECGHPPEPPFMAWAPIDRAGF